MATEGKTGDVYLRARLDTAPLAEDANQGKTIVKDFANSVAQDVQKTNKNLSNLGGGVSEAAQGVVDKVNTVLSKLGSGAEAAFKRNTAFDAAGNKLTESQQRLEAQAQRTNRKIIEQTLAMELGGKGTLAYDTAIQKLKGSYRETADTAGLLANLQAVTAAQAAAAAQFTRAGSNTRELVEGTKAYSAALRQVPAQLTDIVVSLQGGQAPLTVLLQQGGQLKDVFGSVGGAARALGNEVLGLVNPYTVAAAAIGAVVFGYAKGAEETDEFRKALVLSGNQIGTTTGALAGMAQSIASVSGTVGGAADALAQFAASGAVGAGNIQKVTAAALDLEKFGGQAVAETVKQFKSLADDPLKASLKLNESTNFLTVSLYEQIKALTEQGRTIEAANLAQTAFADTIKNRADEIRENLGYFEQGWLAIKGAAKGALDAIKEIGRTSTLDAQIAGAQARLDALQKPGATTRRGLNLTAPVGEADIAAAREELNILNRRALKEQEIATSQAAQALEVANQVAANAILDKYADKQVKMKKEIEATETALKLAGIDRTIIEETILKIREKYAGKKEKPEEIAESRRNLASYVAELQKRIDKEEKLTEVQKANNLLASLGNLGQVAEVRDLLIGLAQKADALEALEAVTKAGAKATEDFNKANEKFFADAAKDLDKLFEANNALALQNETIGLTTEQLNALVLTRKDSAIASLEEAIALAQLTVGYGTSAQEVELLTSRLRELKRERGLTADNQAATAAAKAAKDAEKEWEKTADAIEKSITDSLMRGFENGKGFAENFRDTLENMFKTMILRPIIQATVQGALGLNQPGGAGGAGSLGGVANSFAALSKAVDNLSFALTDFQGFATRGVIDLSNSLAKAGFTDSAKYVNSNAGAIGSGINTAAQGLSYLEALSNFKDGTYGQSIGQAIGTAWAGPIGGQLGKALGGIADRIFGADQGPTNAGVNSNFASDGTLLSRIKPSASQTSNAAVDQFTSLLAVSYQQLALKLGATTKASTFAYQTTSDGFFDVASSAGSSTFNQGRTQYTEAALSLAASRAVFAALQGSELPGYLSKAFTGIVANTASAEQINGALQFAESLKQVRFGLLTAAQQATEYEKIITAGNAALKTTSATFKEDFIKAIDEGLTPEGLAQWSALGGTMQALEQITGKTNSTMRTAADIANERKGLQQELNNLTLTNTQLLAAQRLALDESNRALFDQVQAAKAPAAAKNLDEARNAVQSALNAVADTVRGFARAYADAQQGVEDVRRQIFDQNLQAQNAVAAAQTRVNDLLRASADRLKGFSNSITSFIESLGGGAGAESTQSLKARLSSTAVLAQGGDADAQGKLLDIARAVVDSSKNSSRTAVEFARDQAFVRNTLLDVQNSIKLPEFTEGKSALEAAQDDLLKAQKEAAELQLVAAAAGVDTAATQASVAAQLLSAFSQANTVAEAARTTFEAAKTLTAGLGAGTTSDLAGLAQQLLALGEANASLTDAQTAYNAALVAGGASASDAATALGITDDAAKALAIRLGLTGTAAEAFVKAVTDPVTGTQALSTALGLPGTNAAALAASLGLAGGAATDFIAEIAEIGAGLGTSSINLGTTLNAAGLTISDFVRLIGGTQGTSVVSILTAFGTTVSTTKATLNDVANEIATTLSDAATNLTTPLATAVASLAATIGNAATPFTTAISNMVLSVNDASALLSAALGNAASAANTSSNSSTTNPQDSWTLEQWVEYLSRTNPLFGAGNLLNGVPKLATGTNYVPQDMIAMLHEGEKVVPKAYNPAADGGNMGAMFDALRKEIAALRQEQIAGNSAIAASSQKTAKVLEKWDVDGQPAVAV